MDAIYKILNKIERAEPISLARFNDGEMKAIIKPSGVYTVARGDQHVNNDLRQHLIDALVYEQENYYKGIPCSLCFPNLYREAKGFVRNYYPYLTKAVVNTNRNLTLVYQKIGKLLKDRRVIWIGGSEHDTGKLEQLGVFVYTHIRIPMKDAWDKYNELKNMTFEKDDVVLLSCGPLASVLACEFFQTNPQTTFLDVGSAFEPYTRNIWHRCHTKELPKCSECN